MQNPVVVVGGYLIGVGAYGRLAARLRAAYRRDVYTVPFAGWQWAAVRDWNYTGIVDAVARTVACALHETGAERVSLVAHSAGGRACRLYLGDKPYRGVVYGGARYVDSLMTLGTPHGGIEQYAARLTQFLDETYPGAYFPHIRYVSAVGRSVIGDPNGTFRQRRVYVSYRTQTGDGVEWGDGVIPLRCAYLPGAEHLVLPGVAHFTTGERSYDHPDAMAVWGRHLLPVG